MDELKACPFCGDTEGSGVHVQEIYCPCTDATKYGIICENCGAEIGEFETPEKAAIAWNRRAESENKPLSLEEFESVCESVHNGWWEEKKRQGCTNHPDMLPYQQLSEPVKEYDRVTVRRVLDALEIAYAHKPEQEEK